MAAPESEYGDAYGLPHEQRAQWGAIAEQQRQAAALKGLNPGATQFTNVNPNTAPRASSVQQRAQQLQRGVANYQPRPTPLPNPQPAQQMAREPSKPMPTGGQQVQAPLGGKYSRGYGPSSGLVPEDNQFQRNYFGGGTSHIFRQLASLPNASREIQWFARQSMENES